MAMLPRTPGIRAVVGLATVGLVASAAWAETGPPMPSEPPSPEAGVLQSLMLFFAAFVIAVTWLRGKEVISTFVTVRLLGVALVLGSSLILAFSQLEPDRLMPVMVLLGVSLGLFFSRTEGAEPERREHLTKPPATRDASGVGRAPNGQGQAGIPATRSQEAEENSDASGPGSL